MYFLAYEIIKKFSKAISDYDFYDTYLVYM